jgi:hypothetical protein
LRGELLLPYGRPNKLIKAISVIPSAPYVWRTLIRADLTAGRIFSVPPPGTQNSAMDQWRLSVVRTKYKHMHHFAWGTPAFHWILFLLYFTKYLLIKILVFKYVAHDVFKSSN